MLDVGGWFRETTFIVCIMNIGFGSEVQGWGERTGQK